MATGYESEILHPFVRDLRMFHLKLNLDPEFFDHTSAKCWSLRLFLLFFFNKYTGSLLRITVHALLLASLICIIHTKPLARRIFWKLELFLLSLPGVSFSIETPPNILHFIIIFYEKILSLHFVVFREALKTQDQFDEREIHNNKKRTISVLFLPTKMPLN